MRGPAIQVESFTFHAARLLATSVHRVWRACQVASWRLARQRTRRALAALDDRMLRDVGITREQALREAERPLWWE